jgi:hypothetical protein
MISVNPTGENLWADGAAAGGGRPRRVSGEKLQYIFQPNVDRYEGVRNAEAPYDSGHDGANVAPAEGINPMEHYVAEAPYDSGHDGAR